MTQAAKAASPMQGKRVLVTGATGFLGHHLCRQLAEQGAVIHGTSRREADRCPGEAQGWPKMTWHTTTLDSPRSATELLEHVQAEVIFHLASLVKGSRNRSLVLQAFEANLASAVYLMDAACEDRGDGRGNGRVERFVQVGSLEEAPLSEPPPVPVSPYAASKTAATSYARLYREHYGLSVAVARVFMVYGPGPQDPKKLIPYVIRERLKGNNIQLSSGTRPVDWVYVEDVARGLLALGSTREIPELPVDLGSGTAHTLRAVVEKIYALLGDTEEPPFGCLPDRAQEQVQLADKKSTEDQIDWTAQMSLDDGLAKTIDWFRNRTS